MSSYSRNQNSFHAMSLKKFSDKEPATVQDYGTRKEMKENEQKIKKGFCHIRIAIGITLVTLIVVVAGWGPIRVVELRLDFRWPYLKHLKVLLLNYNVKS